MPNVCRKSSELSLDDGSTAADSSSLLTPPRTPSPTPDTATKSDQPPTKEIDLSVLKCRLNLQDGRCGCITKQGKPCKMYTPENNRTMVDSLIGSMLALTQSSVELEDRLRKLAELVHCRFHPYERHIEDRVEKWTSIFPVGDPDTKPSIPLEKRITIALRRDYAHCNNRHCIGKTLKQEDCRWKLDGRKMQNYTKTINEIIESVVGSDDTKIEYLLKVLAYNGLCHHHQYQSSKHDELWTSRLMEIRSTYQAETKQLDSGCALDGSDESSATSQPESVQSPMLKTKTKQDLENRVDSISIKLVSPPPDQYWPEAFDESPFKILKRRDSTRDRKSSYTEIRANAMLPLEETLGDLKSGFIYLYTVKGNEGFVKIGYTTRSPKQRHEEWKLSCNREPKSLYESSIVPNARRIEALCHAELDYCRTNVYCTGCSIQNIEWFEMTADVAISVIQKWSKWMESHPYTETSPESGVKWALKAEEVKKLDDVDTFMKDLALRFDK
ncbi:T5orf172 domain-containing protein [Trichoderma sp. SZMC 28013]